MRIAILGAGGVGGYFGAMLAKSGHDVSMLARGAHLEALRTRGMEVRTPQGAFVVPVEATDDPARLGPADYALVAVKSYSLDEVAPAARISAEGGAVIVPLLNGVEAVDRLVAASVPAESLLGGFCEINAERLAPGVVTRKSDLHRLVVGEVGGGPCPRGEPLVEAVRESGARADVSDYILVDQWRKFAFISSVAAACGLARSHLGPIRESAMGGKLLRRAVAEAVAVGRGRGVPLPGDMEAKIHAFIESAIPAMKPSFLLDLEAGRPTEIDNLSGAISRFAAELGIETPVHDTATAALGLTRPTPPPAP